MHERKRYRHACEQCRKRKRRCPHDYVENKTKSTRLIASHPSASTSPITAADSSAYLTDSAQLLPYPTPERPSKLLRPRESTRRWHSVDKPPAPQPEAATDPGDETIRTAPSPSSDRISTDHGTSPSSSDIEVDNGPKFVGHLNPEGIFLATTRFGSSEPSKLDDTLGFWLPRTSGREVQEQTERPQTNQERENNHKEESMTTGVQGQRREEIVHPSRQVQQISSPPRRPGSSRSLKSTHIHPNLRVLPELASFTALVDIYLRNVHPIFPILQPELIPQVAIIDDLSPAELVTAQALCLAAATNTAAQPFLRLRNDNNLLKPVKFARRLSQALVAILDQIGSSDRMLCARVFTVLSLFSQLSTDDHTSAEYCARAVSYVHTLQLHLETAHVRKDDALVVRLFLCVWALDRLNVAFHSRPLLIHDRDIGRNMEASIAQQDGCFRTLLNVCALLEKITDLYRPSHKSRASNDSFDLPLFEDLVLQAEAVRHPIHLLATVETLYHSVAMLSYRFQSFEDPDRSSISYLRSTLSAARVITLMETELGISKSNFPFVPYAISLAVRVIYRELRFSKTPLGRSIARGKLLKVCGFLGKFGDRYSFARRLSALAANTVRELDKVAVSVLHARQDNPESADPGGDVDDDAANTTHSEPNHRTTTKEPSHPHIPEYDAEQYNAESFDIVHQIADMPDLFEYFDPKFNLDVVDFALVQNVPADALPNFGFSPDMDWMSVSGMSSVLPDNAENLTLSSSTTL